MKVLIISTAEQAGGGAIAARRLLDALNANGVQAKMLVRDKQTDSVTVSARGNVLPKILERLELMLKLRLPFRRTWGYDTASHGISILDSPEYKEARVIHLHWINQGMLSLQELREMMFSGKRIVWTLHDEWPFRGIIHYSNGKESIESTERFRRLDKAVLKEKRDIYSQGQIHFVGCSQWITDLAKQTMPDQKIEHINNCIPHDIFHPMDKVEVRKELNLPLDKKIILFCSQNMADERKGMKYLDEAISEIQNSKFKIQNCHSSAIEVVRLGKGGRYVSDPKTMAKMYAAADCFVTPSLQDNLPNTIAEAMSCGIPCVGFNVGGIPEMIHHLQDGYVAQYKDSIDLADGIRYVLSHPELGEAAAKTAVHDYSETRVAQEYIKVFEA